MDFSIFSNSWNKWNIDSWMLAQVVLPNFFQFTKSSKIGILDLFTFIFCQIVRIIFHAWYVRLDCQFSKKEMFIFMSTEVLRILFPTWIKGKKCKISLGVQMQIVNKLVMGWGFKCNLLCLRIYIIDIGTDTYQTWNLVQYLFGIRTEISQIRNAVEVFIYLFTVSIFNYKVLFICVKDRAYLKIAIPAYCFNIFGSIFGLVLLTC